MDDHGIQLSPLSWPGKSMISVVECVIMFAGHSTRTNS